MVIHDECLLITVDVKNAYATIDHYYGLNAVSEALQFPNPLFDAIIQLPFH